MRVDNMDSFRLKELDISEADAERFTEALKSPEFRKLCMEYAEEMLDVDKSSAGEQDVGVLQRGGNMDDIRLVSPDPGYVIKTSQNGGVTAFINICKDEHIEKPAASKQSDDNGYSGMAWQIPYSCAPPRHEGQCQIYDVVFHPHTYRMAETNGHFKKLIQDTALDGIEEQYSVKLDRKNLKYPKFKYKGTKQPAVIRSLKEAEKAKEDTLGNVVTTDTKAAEKVKLKEGIDLKDSSKSENGISTNGNGYAKPKYSFTHKHTGDEEGDGEIPDELLLSVELPLLPTSASLNLDIIERKLSVLSQKPAKYKLDVDLPQTIDEDKCSAKFDKTKRILTITLPVIKVPGTHAEVEKLKGSDATDEIPRKIAQKGMVIASADSCAKFEIGQQDVLRTAAVSEDVSAVSSESKGDPDPPLKNQGKESAKNIWLDVDEAPQSDSVEPSYVFHQAECTVSIVVNVANIRRETVTKKYESSGKSVTVSFIAGDKDRTTRYRLHIDAGDHRFQQEMAEVDIGDKNMVLLLPKEKLHAFFWDKIFIGKDASSLQVKECV